MSLAYWENIAPQITHSPYEQGRPPFTCFDRAFDRAGGIFMSGVPGLERGIAILRMFNRERRRISSPQVAAELGIPRSTVHRLLGCLVDLSMLKREPGGFFALDGGVLGLGFEYLASLDIVVLSNPILARLRDETDCSTHLTVRVGTRLVYLSRHPSRSPISSSIGVGSSLPAHATIMGRLLLGSLSSKALRELYKGETLEVVGEKAPRTLRELEKLIREDQQRGYAISTGYYARDVTTVGAPVYDGGGAIAAAINATSIAGRFDSKTLNGPIKDKVLEAARAISATLGAPLAPATRRSA